MDGAWHWVSCLEKRPSWRSEEDLDIILSKLKTMKVFENYPENVLQEMSRIVLYDSFLAEVTLYRPGEPAFYWYAVISGNLEMLDVDPNDSSKTTSICHLQEGDSFGENVIFGTKRQTMIVTRGYSELLYVESENFRRLYQTHKGVMEKLLHLGSCESDSQPGRGEDWADGREKDVATPPSELAIAGMTLQQLINDHFGDLFTDHRVNLYTYRQCCSGRRLVDWVLAQSSVVRTRQQVIAMWQALLTEDIVQHVHKEHPFKDDSQLYYQFIKKRPRSDSMPFAKLAAFLFGEGEGLRLPNGRPRSSSSSVASSPRSSRSSLTSILDECFDTIAQLGPEALIYATLLKESDERTQEDIEMIYEELLHVRALRHLSSAVKREIAACVKLDHFHRAGKYVFHQGSKGDSWYVILKGSVNVVIRGKGVVCTLHEGDDFGKLSLVNEGTRSASIQAREDNCYFLRIEREDFRRILFSVESTMVKFTEHDREVLFLERGVGGKYSVVKGTADKMLDHMLETEIEEGRNVDTFVEDFLLTYPAFMTTSELCEGLRKRYYGHGPGDKNGTLEVPSTSNDVENVRKRRVTQVVSLWVRAAQQQLVKDGIFLQLVRELQDSLDKEGLTEELKLLNSSLSDSMRGSAFNGHITGSPVLPLKSRKGSSVQDPEIKVGICTLPPCQPQDKTPLRVHTIDHICCRLQVRLDTSAQEIIREACGKLGLEAADYNLCEVTSEGEKVKFQDSDISVHSGMSVNGRLYIVPKTNTAKSLPTLPDQNQKPVTVFPEKDSSREVAAHLTVYDWSLFSNIQQMEFIYSVFGRHKFGKITTNLDLLVRRFNEVQFWVVTELCSEPDLIKRANMLKKFIKIAGYCKSFNDLNSFFAIVVGLMNAAVTRLRQTWKELPLKLKRRFDQFEALTDPSRNHKVLRAYQSKLPPPVIPFMPLVMKDAYFLHEGNETFIDGLVNFEKMRLVASKVRGLINFGKGSLPSDVRSLTNKNPSLQQYIRSLRVLDNQRLLTQMSHKVEPSVKTTPFSS